MEIAQVVKDAIKQPNDYALNSLPEYVQGLIYTVSTYCIDNNKGELKKAHEVNELIIPIIKNRLTARTQKKVENIFSKLINKDDWECEICMLNNDKDSSKCIACGSLKPGLKDSPVDKPLKPKQGIKLVEKYVKKPTEPTEPENIEQPTYGEEKEYDKRGVSSVITAFQLLKKLNYKKTTSVDIYINNSSSPAIRVYYNSIQGLDKMFAVYESYNSLGVDKELVLWGPELKNYIIEIFSRKNKSGTFQFKISKIDINISNNIKRFYIDFLGIVWNQEDCAECHLKQKSGLDLDPKCKKLIDSNCSDNFRYKPKVETQPIPKPTPKAPPIQQPILQFKEQTKKITVETDQRGVNSIIIACKEVLPKIQKFTLDVYINDNSTPEFKITYKSTGDTPTAQNGIYKIVNTKDSETNNLLFEQLKQYIHNIFDKNSKKHYIVSKINLSLTDGNHKRFYIESLGIVWNQDDCTDCILQERNGEELSDNCKKLLKEKCGDKFRYRKID